MTSRTVPTLATALLVGLSAVADGQAQSYARVLRSGSEAVMSVLDPRPLDAAATLLAREFGLQVNVEDPLYFGRDDVEDVTGRAPGAAGRTSAISAVATILERRFELDAAGFPRDVRQLLRDAVNDTNAQSPFAYRLDSAGDVFTLVATRTRDSQGRPIQFTPILDRRVTVPRATRRVADHVALLMRALEAETGVRVGCCSATNAEWGSAVVAYGGIDEPARAGLQRLLHAEATRAKTAESEPVRYQWLLRCQTSDLWCFINVVRIPARH
jgi:hypothetical protein